MRNNFFFPKIVPCMDNVENCCRPEQATDGNTTIRMAPAHYMLDT